MPTQHQLFELNPEFYVNHALSGGERIKPNAFRDFSDSLGKQGLELTVYNLLDRQTGLPTKILVSSDKQPKDVIKVTIESLEGAGLRNAYLAKHEYSKPNFNAISKLLDKLEPWKS